MFPIIHHINDLLPFISSNPQFRVAEQPNGFTVVCYMLQDEDTFRGEHEDWYKECRGITFAPDGSVASRTLHKFQNVGENDATAPDEIPWDRIVRIMDKRDGSMITPVLMPDGSIKCKTKKTFTSAEAIEATKLLNSDPKKVAWVLKFLTNGLTPTFEWTSPRFPIVLLYEKDELTLLQVRNNKTGTYFTDMFFWNYVDDVPFPVVENLIEQFLDDDDSVSWPKLREMALTRDGIEGVIIQADDGRMWKVKTKWYCDLHHSVTFTRYRDVARSICADQSDDLKGAFALTGRSIEPILVLEEKIAMEIDRVRSNCEDHVGLGKGFNRTNKDMALALGNHPFFPMIMRMYRGQEVDWFAWYLKNRIRDHSLEVIPSSSQNEDTEIPVAVEDEEV